VLRVSVAGYHEHLARRRDVVQRRHLSNEALLVYIRAVYVVNRGAYGWPRIWRQLREEGIRVGKQRVQRLTQQHGIRARGKRRFRIATTDSRHGLPIAPNLLDRNFTAARPNQVWVGDITYIPTDEAEAIVPTLTREDPRYYTLGPGRVRAPYWVFCLASIRHAH
jgi:transposase InsO family protein